MSAPTPTLPDATRLLQHSAHDDGPEDTNAFRPCVAQRPISPILEYEQLISHAHHYSLHDGGPDTAGPVPAQLSTFQRTTSTTNTSTQRTPSKSQTPLPVATVSSF